MSILNFWKRDIDILDTDEKIFNEYFSDAEKYKKATFSRKYSTIRGLYKFLLKNRYIEKYLNINYQLINLIMKLLLKRIILYSSKKNMKNL